MTTIQQLRQTMRSRRTKRDKLNVCRLAIRAGACVECALGGTISLTIQDVWNDEDEANFYAKLAGWYGWPKGWTPGQQGRARQRRLGLPPAEAPAPRRDTPCWRCENCGVTRRSPHDVLEREEMLP